MQINHIPPVLFFQPNQQNSSEHYIINNKQLSHDCFCKTVNAKPSFSGSNPSLKILKESFGITKAGEIAELFTITNKKGAKLILSSLGATIVGITVPDKNGKKVNVVQGYDSVAAYDGIPNGHAGGTIGPYANKISNGSFFLNGQEYQLEKNKDNGKTHCHGASAGLDIKNWKSETLENGVRFTLLVPDGEGGYPGNRKVTVTYTFDNDNRIRIDYKATTDKDTILNLTNHSYFNLDGAENTQKNSVNNHIVQLPNSSTYTVNGQYSVSTGEIAKVNGTSYDFTIPRAIGDNKYDQNFCVDNYNGKDIIDVAKIKSSKTGIVLTVSSNYQGFQFYTANNLGKKTQPETPYGGIYEENSAFCIEPQFYPDAINKFPEKGILKKGEEYNKSIIYKFETEK